MYGVSHKQLHVLNLSNNKLNDDAIRAISRNLKELPELNALDLCHNEMTDVGAGHLAKELKACSKLTELNIVRNFCTTKGTADIVSAIQELRDFEHLSADYYPCTARQFAGETELSGLHQEVSDDLA